MSMMEKGRKLELLARVVPLAARYLLHLVTSFTASFAEKWNVGEVPFRHADFDIIMQPGQ